MTWALVLIAIGSVLTIGTLLGVILYLLQQLVAHQQVIETRDRTIAQMQERERMRISRNEPRSFP